MIHWRVSINVGDWEDIESETAGEAGKFACDEWAAKGHERRAIDLLIVQKAERDELPRVRVGRGRVPREPRPS